MKLHRGLKQSIIFLLAFLMAFEPFAVNMVYADPDSDSTGAEVTVPTAETMDMSEDDFNAMNTENGLENTFTDADGDESQVLKPVDYLDYMYSLRGRSKAEIEEIPLTDENGNELSTQEKIKRVENAFVWGEWMNTISGAYAMMDDGCTDVFSFYNTLGEFVSQANNAGDYLTMLTWATNKAALCGAFIARVTGLSKVGTKVATWVKSKANLMKGLGAVNNLYSKGARNVTGFISHMCPPVGFRKGCEAGEGFVSYFRWVARKTKLDECQRYKDAIAKVNSHLSKENQISTVSANRAVDKSPIGSTVINDSKGIATTIGIGLTIIGIAFDSYNLFAKGGENYDDNKAHRASYPVVKTAASLLLGIGSLVAMFCVPVVGQVLGVIALVWTCITLVADQFGKYNKRWKAAYKNSYWFLYENDPDFKTYYDQRDDLIDDEKSAAYIVTERNYGEYKAGAREFEKNNKGENSYYDDKSEEAVSARIFIELEKQGVLTSYYNCSSFQLPDYSMDRLLELWKAKADYMAWKPTEEEETRANNRGFWGKIGHAINPMTYISWAGDKLNSIKYNSLNKKYDIEKVYFNPDFVLMKKYQTWITANRKMEEEESETNNNNFYRAIGLRIEQAPFNYIPLVGIDMASWNDDLLIQAFNCDAFFVGVKEMMYFRNMIEPATKQVKEFTKNVTDSMKDVRKTLDFFKKRYDVLARLLENYKNDLYKNDKNKGWEIFRSPFKVKDAFGWNWNSSYGEHTPKRIMSTYWNDINTALTSDSLSVSQIGADCQLFLDAIKKNLNLATLMQELYDEKQEALDTFDQDFKNIEFNEYLKKNKFLNVHGFGIMDWLSDLYPAYDELKKYNKLYKNEIDSFAKAAEDSNTGHKKVFFFFTAKDDKYHPNTVLTEINALLKAYKELLADFESISDELEQDGLILATIKSDDDKIYPEDGFDTLPEGEEVEVIDIEDDVDENISNWNVTAVVPDGD